MAAKRAIKAPTRATECHGGGALLCTTVTGAFLFGEIMSLLLLLTVMQESLACLVVERDDRSSINMSAVVVDRFEL